MTGSRLPILSAGQVALYLRGITAAIKSAWANRKALVCLWGVNGERHWRQEVLRKWKALYCAPEWPGIRFPLKPNGKTALQVLTQGHYNRAMEFKWSIAFEWQHHIAPFIPPSCVTWRWSLWDFSAEMWWRYSRGSEQESGFPQSVHKNVASSAFASSIAAVAWVQQQVRGAVTHHALQHDIIKPLKLNWNIDPLQADLP